MPDTSDSVQRLFEVEHRYLLRADEEPELWADVQFLLTLVNEQHTEIERLQALPRLCPTCKGLERVACPGPTAKTNAERAQGRKYIDWCYGMHMGHPCPDCVATDDKA